MCVLSFTPKSILSQKGPLWKCICHRMKKEDLVVGQRLAWVFWHGSTFGNGRGSKFGGRRGSGAPCERTPQRVNEERTNESSASSGRPRRSFETGNGYGRCIWGGPIIRAPSTQPALLHTHLSYGACHSHIRHSDQSVPGEQRAVYHRSNPAAASPPSGRGSLLV